MDNIKNNKPINAVSTIAEMTGGIILASFKKPERNNTSYQTEAQLENQLIENLVMQG